MIFVLLSLLIAALMGFFIVDLLDFENKSDKKFVFRMLLGMGLGYGLVSILFFFFILLNLKPLYIYFESILFIVLAAVWFVKKGKKISFSSMDKNHKGQIWLNIMLILGFILAIILFLQNSYSFRHGEYDAIFIWNNKARFFYRVLNWHDLPLSRFAHLDYPLLLPSLIARCWTFISNETVLLPIFVAFSYTFAIPLMLFSYFEKIKSFTIARLAPIVLLLTPVFLMKGENQVADVPLGYYFLAVLLLLNSKDKIFSQKTSYLLAGIMASLGFWMKNEGLLFALLVLIVFGINAILKKDKDFLYFIYGMSPVFLTLIIFKTTFSYNNDLVSALKFNLIVKDAFDWSRHKVIIDKFILVAFDVIKSWWGFIPLLIYFHKKKVFFKEKNPELILSMVVLFVMMIGYYLTYLFTYLPLQWHLDTSLNRLYMQLLPSIIFVFFSGLDKNKIEF